jgi:hypothetical protein
MNTARTPLFVPFLFAGCAITSTTETSSVEQPVVYGEDDRVDLYRVTDPALAAFVRERGLALVLGSAVAAVDGVAKLDSTPLGERAGLCPGERFADQPAPVQCTAVLVEERLALTASHCVAHLRCEQMALIRGYAFEEEGRPTSITEGEVRRCAAVVTQARSSPAAEERVDYAWILLDGPLPVAAPLVIRGPEEPLQAGESLIEFGHGSGLPLKLDRGTVADPRSGTSDYFLNTADNFHSGSGAPLIDSEFRLAGIQSRGAADYIPTEAGCSVLAQKPDTPDAAEEQATYAFRALDALCEQAPWATLCGGSGDAEDRQNGCTVAAGVRRRTSGVFVSAVAALLLIARRLRAGIRVIGRSSS